MDQIFVKRSCDQYYIKAKYSENEDIVFVVGKGGGNNLPDIRCVYTVLNSGSLNTDLRLARMILNHSTDLIGPNIVKAVMVGDGDHPEQRYFTGGNHQSNNKGSGGNITARCDMLSCICDGVVVNSAAFGNDIELIWTNYLQGYNTTLENGVGREILREDVIMRFSGTSVQVRITHTALEDVIRETYYGLQMVTSDFSEVLYDEGSKRLWHPVGVMSASGGCDCRKIQLKSLHFDCIDIGILKDGLGTFLNNRSGYSAFNMQYGKCYFNLIRDVEFRQNKGETTAVIGYYHFYNIKY